MPRYVSMPANSELYWEWHNGSDSLARTVHEDEQKPVDTGLLGHDGRKIFRTVDRQPIGFVRLGEP